MIYYVEIEEVDSFLAECEKDIEEYILEDLGWEIRVQDPRKDRDCQEWLLRDKDRNYHDAKITLFKDALINGVFVKFTVTKEG